MYLLGHIVRYEDMNTYSGEILKSNKTQMAKDIDSVYQNDFKK